MTSCPARGRDVERAAGALSAATGSAVARALVETLCDGVRSQAPSTSKNAERTRTNSSVAELRAACSCFSRAWPFVDGGRSAAANREHLLQIGLPGDHLLHPLLQQRGHARARRVRANVVDRRLFLNGDLERVVGDE